MIPFWKTQSVGNDFILLHASDLSANGIDPLGDALGPVAITLSDRRFGVGGDGLLVLDSVGDALRLRMFNSDGSEDFCGNGMRCAMTHARGLGWVGDQTIIHHGGHSIEAWIEDGVASTRLLPASFAPADIPSTLEAEVFESEWRGSGLVLSVLSTGSAHAVTFVEEFPSDAEFERISRAVEHDPAFPERVSLMWARAEGPRTVRIRIWERGVGETLGCGTGSTAVAVVWARRHGPGPVEVLNPGGALRVELDDWRGRPVVSGRAVETFSGRFAPKWRGSAS